MKKSTISIALLLVLFAGCDLIKSCQRIVPDISTEVIAALDRGISQLGLVSADWQDVLNEVIRDLPQEVQSTITNEVTNLLNRGIAASGAEVRCNVDFFRNRMKQGLQRIKAKFLETDLPPLEPQLCSVVPLAIDMSLPANRRNKIEFYGYDFDMTDIQVVQVVGSREVNVSNKLDQPTHYHMTLNLGGTGVALNANSKRLILRWQNRNISTIAVIQPAPDICETKFKNFRPSNLTVIPVHGAKPGKSKGDREFDGHGPTMSCTVTLINRGNRVEANIKVTASETKSDWTYGSKNQTFNVFNADPGYIIEKIITPATASQTYTDNDHTLDEFGGGGPVQKFIFNGDGNGADIGSNTKVTVQFNNIRVQLKESGDCVSTATLKSLELNGGVSEELKTIMDTNMKNFQFIAPSELKVTPEGNE